MKNKIKYILKLTSIVLVILIILEFSLSIIFNHNDTKRKDENTQIKIASGAYENLEPSVVKEIYNELFELDASWEPFVHFKMKAFKGKHININEKGIRSTINFNTKDTINKVKIFCFGGSTMFSTGARDSHTIPSELSKIIYKSFPNLNIEITNFGCLAYNRSIENAQLQQQLLQNNIPNIVVFYDGVNEVLSAHQNNKAGLPTNASNRKNEFKLAHNYSKRIKLLFSASHINRFIIYLQRRIFKTIPFEVDNPNNLSKAIATNYINNLKLTRGIAQEYNFKVFNFLQPVIYTKSPLTEFEKPYAKQSYYYKGLYTKSYDLIENDNNIVIDTTFKDISNTFNNSKKTIYTDFCHTGELGNQLVAEKIFSSLKPLLIEENRNISN